MYVHAYMCIYINCISELREFVTQLCLTLCHPMDCSPPGSSVYRTLQVRILEGAAIPSSRGSSWPRDWTWVSCIAHWFLTVWATLYMLHLYLGRLLSIATSSVWRHYTLGILNLLNLVFFFFLCVGLFHQSVNQRRWSVELSTLRSWDVFMAIR